MDYKSKFLSFAIYDGGIWVRVLGRGFGITDRRKYPMLRSERINKPLLIFGWSIKYLGKYK